MNDIISDNIIGALLEGENSLSRVDREWEKNVNNRIVADRAIVKPRLENQFRGIILKEVVLD